MVVLEKPKPLTTRLRFPEALVRLRAVVLLGGSVRPKMLARSIGRPVFALPLENGLTILDAANADGTPSGIMLVQAQALKAIPETGFSDMKEQALPAIAANYRVTVASFESPSGLPVRSLGEYVAALRQYHLALLGRAED